MAILWPRVTGEDDTQVSSLASTSHILKRQRIGEVFWARFFDNSSNSSGP